MNELVRSAFTGNWKSYKHFKKGGTIKLDSTQEYNEFDFTKEHILTIKQHHKNGIERVVKTDDWSIELKGHKHFLVIQKPALSYEVVTLNHTDMVLLEEKTADKIFYAFAPFWEDRLKSNKKVTM